MSGPSKTMFRRGIQPVVEALFTEEPVIVLQGPRTVGKSALLAELAAKFNVSILDLDDIGTREAVIANPGLFMGGQPPVMVDEYQKAPVLLGAIKNLLTPNATPGRFVLTRSTRHDALPILSEALSGRLHLTSLYPLTQGEITGSAVNILEQLLNDPRSTIRPQQSTTVRSEYIEKILIGGFPLAIGRQTPASRSRWIDDYVKLTLERDARELKNVRNVATLENVLKKLAGQTAQVLNINSVAQKLGYTQDLVSSHTKLLEDVFLVHRVEAWGKTLTSRAVSHPKIHVTDSAIAARLLRLTTQKLNQTNPTVMSEFGHLLESFVVNELIRQATWTAGIAGIGHWRVQDGDEVDLIVEKDDGGIVGIEIKAGSRVPIKEIAPMRNLRKKMGDNFIAGVVFHLGTTNYTVEDRIHVMPVDRLWVP